MTWSASRVVSRSRAVLAVPALLCSSALALAACSSGSPISTTRATVPRSSTTTSASAAAGTFCDAAQRVANDQNTVRQQANSAAVVLSAAQDAESAIPLMQRLAPTSLSSDVTMVTSTFKPFFDALVSGHGNLSRALPVEQQISAHVTTPQFQAAQSAVSSYEAQTCGSSPSGRN